jgi:hypothetical protein
VTVTTNGIDCAGQFVVTALGAPGAPPSVLVQFIAFIVGPAFGSNDATGFILVAAGNENNFKITASCNGSRRSERAFAFSEFWVEAT